MFFQTESAGRPWCSLLERCICKQEGTFCFHTKKAFPSVLRHRHRHYLTQDSSFVKDIHLSPWLLSTIFGVRPNILFPSVIEKSCCTVPHSDQRSCPPTISPRDEYELTRQPTTKPTKCITTRPRFGTARGCKNAIRAAESITTTESLRHTKHLKRFRTSISWPQPVPRSTVWYLC